MSGALAYHAVVHALEAKGGWTPIRRFAASVKHALDGHLPYRMYYEAGVACEREGAGEGAIERLVREQFALDLNPITQGSRLAWYPANFIWVFHEYNKAVNLGVRSTAELAPHVSQRQALVRKRETLATSHDPEGCRMGLHFAIENYLRQILENARTGTRPQVTRMSDVARYLGLEHSIVREASLALEAQGGIPIPQLARELGCHQRTLERRLREDGLTAEMLRQVARLLRTMEGIRAGDSLAMVAADAGFSDQAHMTRVFRASCGLTPSVWKQVMSDKVMSA